MWGEFRLDFLQLYSKSVEAMQGGHFQSGLEGSKEQ
jgi:hypothetical protein